MNRYMVAVDTAANFTSANPTLLAGQIGLESNTGKYKVGTGATAWTSLAYVSGYFPGGTDVAVADGGTGASTAAGARTNLDVPSNAETILDAIVDAKGDLIAATAADTVARVAVGANDTVLTADSAQSAGVKWAAPAGGGIAQGRAAYGAGPTKALTLPGAVVTANPGARTITLNRGQYAAYVVQTPIVIDALVWEITANVASTNVRAAIYNADANWQPTTLVAGTDTGSVSSATTGVKTGTFSGNVTIPAGRYLVWFNCDGTGVTLRAVNGVMSNLIGYAAALGGSTYIGELYAAQTYGAPPSTGLAWDTVSFSSSNNTYGWMFFWRVVTP